MGSGSNCDNLGISGFNINEIGDASGISNAPFGYCIILTFKPKGNQTAQLAISHENIIKVRYKDGSNAWTAWSTV